MSKKVHITCYCGNDLGIHSTDYSGAIHCKECGVDMVMDSDGKGIHGETYDEEVFEHLVKLIESAMSLLSSAYVDVDKVVSEGLQELEQ